MFGRRKTPVSTSILACISCGYDLLGNTTGVCPECGATWDPNRLMRAMSIEDRERLVRGLTSVHRVVLAPFVVFVLAWVVWGVFVATGIADLLTEDILAIVDVMLLVFGPVLWLYAMMRAWRRVMDVPEVIDDEHAARHRRWVSRLHLATFASFGLLIGSAFLAPEFLVYDLAFLLSLILFALLIGSHLFFL
ncbi:MAG: hypothetical protein KDA28_13330, partial [Phycisphaerales bacterium]|nr:hypothetical protein [Phycisphaerales bacterium]